MGLDEVMPIKQTTEFRIVPGGHRCSNCDMFIANSIPHYCPSCALMVENPEDDEN